MTAAGDDSGAAVPAQNARAEHPAPLPSALTGPLMPMRPWRPLVTLTAVVAAATSAAFAVAGLPLGIAVVGALGVVAVVVGWAPLLTLPSPRGTTGVLAFAAVVLGGAGWSARPGRSGIGDLDAVLIALFCAVLAAFGHQVARRDGRPRLVESLISTVSGVLLIAAWAASLPMLTRPGAMSATIVVAAAVACAGIGDVVRGRWVDDVPAIVIAAALASAGAAGAARVVDVSGLSAGVVVAAGILAGLGSYALRQIFFVQPTQSRRRPQVASGAGSWLLVSVLVSALVSLVA